MNFPSATSSVALPSASMFDHLLGDGIVRFVLTAGVLYSGYGWWALDLSWGWLAFWAVGFVIADNAHRRVLRIEAFLPKQGPSLCTRMLGHPILAVPVILCSVGWLAVLIMHLHDRGVTFETANGGHIITLGFFALPVLIFGRWFLQRKTWRSAVGSTDTGTAVAPSPLPLAPEKPVPIARLLFPKVVSKAPDLTCAVQNLPPALLDLVREGIARKKHQMDAA